MVSSPVFSIEVQLPQVPDPQNPNALFSSRSAVRAATRKVWPSGWPGKQRVGVSQRELQASTRCNPPISSRSKTSSSSPAPGGKGTCPTMPFPFGTASIKTAAAPSLMVCSTASSPWATKTTAKHFAWLAKSSTPASRNWEPHASWIASIAMWTLMTSRKNGAPQHSPS